MSISTNQQTNIEQQVAVLRILTNVNCPISGSFNSILNKEETGPVVKFEKLLPGKTGPQVMPEKFLPGETGPKAKFGNVFNFEGCKVLTLQLPVARVFQSLEFGNLVLRMHSETWHFVVHLYFYKVFEMLSRP